MGLGLAGRGGQRGYRGQPADYSEVLWCIICDKLSSGKSRNLVPRGGIEIPVVPAESIRPTPRWRHRPRGFPRGLCPGRSGAGGSVAGGLRGRGPREAFHVLPRWSLVLGSSTMAPRPTSCARISLNFWHGYAQTGWPECSPEQVEKAAHAGGVRRCFRVQSAIHQQFGNGPSEPNGREALRTGLRPWHHPHGAAKAAKDFAAEVTVSGWPSPMPGKPESDESAWTDPCFTCGLDTERQPPRLEIRIGDAARLPRPAGLICGTTK